MTSYFFSPAGAASAGFSAGAGASDFASGAAGAVASGAFSSVAAPVGAAGSARGNWPEANGTVADLVVFVGMVQIRAVRMLVLRSLVAVRMAVRTRHRWIVHMRVMSIVVAVGVFVLDGIMNVTMMMSLG